MSQTELRIGTLMPMNPVLVASPARYFLKLIEEFH
jgi:hypothetical protein